MPLTESTGACSCHGSNTPKTVESPKLGLGSGVVLDCIDS